MSDSIPTAGVSTSTPSGGGAAPAAPAPSAPSAPSASGGASSVPTPGSGVPTTPEEQSGLQSRTSEAWETHDWGSWGGDVEELRGVLEPKYMGLADRISEWHRNDYSGKRKEIERLRELYSAMVDGSADPRVGDLEKELKTLRGQHEKAQEEAKSWPQRYESLQGQYKGFMQARAREDADRFWEKHGSIKEDPAKVEKFGQLLNPNGPFGGEWDAYAAAELLDLSEESFRTAVEAKREGAPEKTAIKLAKAEDLIERAHAALQERAAAEASAMEEIAKRKAIEPRPAARITSGAERTTAPRPASPSPMDSQDLDERRLFAVRRAMRVHSGGKR